MNADKIGSPRPPAARADDLTPIRLLRIVLFSAVVWLLVALYIRTGGPAGEFAPARRIELFVPTVLVTFPLNWLTRKISGMPPEKMATVIAAASFTPPILEGLLMSFYPRFYGDPAVFGQAAVWLVFAIGVAMMAATFTTLLASKRLRVGDQAPPIQAVTVRGDTVAVPEPDRSRAVPLTHVQFLRFAGCPVCNLHLRSFIKRHAELRAAGVREVVLFHSEPNFIDDYYGDLPFDLIADPGREIYARYRVETSPAAILSPMAWPGLIQGYRLKKAGEIDSTPLGLPADFLIDASGRIVDRHYGVHSGDQWSVEDVLARARGRRPAAAMSPRLVIGATA